LEAEGRTAAILGHGLDLTYPPEAFKLRQRMTERGCVLAEFPLGRPADRQSFPQRNRIVAGLAQAVIVVETDVDGGSMITARFAGEQGKTLCALPGRVDSPTSRGCHALIRDGATLVSSLDDILAELGEARGQLTLPLEKLDAADARWLKHFGGGTAHHSESLAQLTQCSQAEAAVALTMLEIKGHLLRRSDGRHERV
jgi:DNA processing protein